MKTIILVALTMAYSYPMQAQTAALSQSVKQEFARSWELCKKYAWTRDTYEQPLHTALIDAYSTLKIMGLQKQAREVEKYVMDSCNADQDVYVKTYETNTRVLGGLLSIYSYTHHPIVLAKAKDLGDRLLKAFRSPTGIPYYRVNLKTGKTDGEKVSTAEAAAYTFEMGILSYYTKDPKYYQAAKKALMAIYGRRSKLDLVGEMINAETGDWISTTSFTGEYYEYLLKTALLFRDPEVRQIWDKSISAVHKYDATTDDTTLWYGRADMYSGEIMNTIVTQDDAFLPALLCLDDDAATAAKQLRTWNSVWNRYGLAPLVYDYRKQKVVYPQYDLNPGIIASAWYLYDYTRENSYLEMGKQYYNDILRYCKSPRGFSAITDVRSKKQRDELPPHFFGETMKYLYLLFTPETGLNTEEYILSSAAHPFKIADFKATEAVRRLGINT